MERVPKGPSQGQGAPDRPPLPPVLPATASPRRIPSACYVKCASALRTMEDLLPFESYAKDPTRELYPLPGRYGERWHPLLFLVTGLVMLVLLLPLIHRVGFWKA